MSRDEVAYRKLFSDSRLVHDLLVGFVDEPWVRELDFRMLVPVRPSFLAQQLGVFESQQAWKVVHRPSRRALYVLLEFQSSVDPWMALRMANCALLLKIEAFEDRPRPQDRLAAVFPMVIYRGTTPWSAVTDFRVLHGELPESLMRYVPSWEYALLDIQATPVSELPRGNLVSYVIRLEKSSQFDELLGNLEELGREVTADDDPLRLAFLRWVVSVLVPSAVRRGVRWSAVRDFDQGLTMLRERWHRWVEQDQR